MADDRVVFELASPERLVVSEDVDMVVVPGSEGDFGVLPGHAPFISTVRPGVIDVYQGERIDQRIFVSDGFAEVNQRRCTVLASEAYPIEALDRGDIEARLKSAEAELSDADTDEERVKAEAEVTVCEAMLAAVG
jgi:F-type H+-transporting ATPase subunit epsilon